MKRLSFFAFLVSFQLLFSQDIDKKTFERIQKLTQFGIYSIEKHNSQGLIEKLELGEHKNSKVLSEIISNKDRSFNSSKDSIFTQPSYMFKNDGVEVTINSVKLLPKKAKEKFPRARYFFVIRLIMKSDGEKLLLSNKEIFATKTEINKWWLSQYKKYNTETKKVYDKFGFIPPPPSLPPATLK